MRSDPSRLAVQEAIRLGTEVEQLHILKRFEEEIRQTPQRRKLYQEVVDRLMKHVAQMLREIVSRAR
jgi:hypothetical protein